MRLLYTLFIHAYYAGIYLAGFFNAKARLWIRGRKGIFKQLAETGIATGEYIWFHCASLGEFEQGRPVIEAIKKQVPDCKILLTFFSPSGFEVRKNYAGADHTCYLPLDTAFNAKSFIKLTQPKAVFFIKYEFWFNYLQVIAANKIPLFLISGIFRQEQHFFQWYGSWFRKQLGHFSYFFVQNETSKSLLHQLEIKRVLVSGDTRFDRVHAITHQRDELPLISRFKHSGKLLVAGSTWQKDEDLICLYIKAAASNPDLKFIIAPHEVNPSTIHELLQKLKAVYSEPAQHVLRYSQATEQGVDAARVLIIDNIGLLSSLYYYADVAYIGGGFGKGIHNILEAVAFGVPVIFGPNYHKFQEAVELIAAKGAFSIDTHIALTKTLDFLFSDEAALAHVSAINKKYISEKKGATEKIIENTRQWLY